MAEARACDCSDVQQLRDLELIPGIERRRRLVEQQHVGLLRQRGRDDDALLLAAAERRERARPRTPDVPVAASASRAMLEVGRAFDRERARDAGSGPSAPSRARCSRTPDACSCGTIAMRCASARRDHRATGWPSSSDRRRPSAPAAPPSSLSSVVLPEPFGPEDADERAGRDVERHVAHDAARCAGGAGVRPPYANERLRADSNPHTSEHAERPERRVAVGFFVRPIEQVQRAPEDLDARIATRQPAPASTTEKPGAVNSPPNAP